MHLSNPGSGIRGNGSICAAYNTALLSKNMLTATVIRCSRLRLCGVQMTVKISENPFSSKKGLLHWLVILELTTCSTDEPTSNFSAPFLSKCDANYAPLTPLSMFSRTVLINPHGIAYIHAFKAGENVCLLRTMKIEHYQ